MLDYLPRRHPRVREDDNWRVVRLYLNAFPIAPLAWIPAYRGDDADGEMSPCLESIMHVL